MNDFDNKYDQSFRRAELAVKEENEMEVCESCNRVDCQCYEEEQEREDHPVEFMSNEN